MCSVHDLTCEISAGFGLSNAKLSVSAISQFTDKCDSGGLTVVVLFGVLFGVLGCLGARGTRENCRF